MCYVAYYYFLIWNNFLAFNFLSLQTVYIWTLFFLNEKRYQELYKEKDFKWDKKNQMAIFYRGQQKNYQKIVQCFEFLFLCLIHKFPLKYTMRCFESPSEETTLEFSVNMIARATSVYFYLYRNSISVSTLPSFWVMVSLWIF